MRERPPFRRKLLQQDKEGEPTDELPDFDAQRSERRVQMAFDSAFRDAEPPCDLIVRQPFAATDTMGKFDVEATVTGGGVTGQAGAIRHGIARALLQVEDSYRAPLKAAGLLTRDPRMKERKKYGLKAARRAPQFSKR